MVVPTWVALGQIYYASSRNLIFTFRNLYHSRQKRKRKKKKKEKDKVAVQFSINFQFKNKWEQENIN